MIAPVSGVLVLLALAFGVVGALPPRHPIGYRFIGIAILLLLIAAAVWLIETAPIWIPLFAIAWS